MLATVAGSALPGGPDLRSMSIRIRARKARRSSERSRVRAATDNWLR
jgi:hypothetical protein